MSETGEVKSSAERREEVLTLWQCVGGRTVNDHRVGSTVMASEQTFLSFITTLDAQSAERTRAREAEALSRISDLTLAIQGCEKHSSDADFEALGALVYRNRAVLLGALADDAERTRAEVVKMREAAARVADDNSNWKAGEHAPPGFDVLNRGKNQNARVIAAAIRALPTRPD